MKYSIIVPVYKVEKVLPRCIDSILNQTVADFELILVDDGSPDNSGAICDTYATQDARVRVIHQQNGGVSKARNAGLDAAQGEYIVFVDSDDYVDADFLAGFDDASADMIIAGYRIEGYGVSIPTIHKFEKQLFEDITNEERIELFEKGRLNYACTKAFRTSLVQKHKIRFDENMSLSEDTLFTVQCAMWCKSIWQIDAAGYHYVKYAHATLTGSGTTSTAMIDKIEAANDRLYKQWKKNIGERAETVITNRIGLLYHNILLEFACDANRAWKDIRTLFRQKWFRKTLERADEFFADENIKYRMLLKTKSALLCGLYWKYGRK